MKSDVITVSRMDGRTGIALREIEKVSAYKGYTGKSALHLRLLTEEMMGMMRSITGEKEGKFWIEEEDNNVALHLQVETRMSSDKREQLLGAATSGKNESAKSLMGWLRDLFDRGADEDIAANTSPLLLPCAFENSSLPVLDWDWSMMEYQHELTQIGRETREAQEAWDGLEKSVVAHVADEVKVSIRGSKAELIIYKKVA